LRGFLFPLPISTGTPLMHGNAPKYGFYCMVRCTEIFLGPLLTPYSRLQVGRHGHRTPCDAPSHGKAGPLDLPTAPQARGPGACLFPEPPAPRHGCPPGVPTPTAAHVIGHPVNGQGFGCQIVGLGQAPPPVPRIILSQSPGTPRKHPALPGPPRGAPCVRGAPS